MRSIFVILSIFTSINLYGVLSAEVEAGLHLVRENKTDYHIVIPEKAVAAESHAAAELALFLKQSTGVVFPVVAEPEAGTGPMIYVGLGRQSRTLVAESLPEKMESEEFIMETHGPHLVLAGGSPRGTLYAVYSFLEDVVGFHWYAAHFTRVPKLNGLDVGTLKSRHKPAFEYRQTLVYDSLNGDWSARNKINGHASRLEDQHGGQIRYAGFVHTFFDLVPPSKYFAKHPEYYSEIGGKRRSERAQLCLTNAELMELVARRVIEMTKDAPPNTIVSVSQNDWNGWCACDRCRKVMQEEGALSGALLRFVNAVAERVEKARPHIAIDTLAYQDTRKPPRLARPRPNVIIRLCSIECSFSHPLAGDGPNRAFADDIGAWSKICQRLYIWDYVANFSHYLQPHPNFRVLQPNLAFFADHGVRGVLEQGNHKSAGGEFEELRSWVLAKLLWNPKADTDKLVDDFIHGYYGAAAAPVREYFDLIHDAVEKSGVELHWGTPPTAAFLTPELIMRADQLWESAEQTAVQTKDRGLLYRVRAGRLPVYYVMLARGQTWQQTVPTWKPALSGSELRQRFSEIAASSGVTRVSEKRSLDEYRETILKLDRHDALPPPECKGLNAAQWLDIQDDQFTLAVHSDEVRLKADPAASDGVAARMPGNHRQWAIQMPLALPESAQTPGKLWRMAVSVRVEKIGHQGTAFTCGLYDFQRKKEIFNKPIPASAIQGDGYALYDIGTHTASPELTLWIAPADNEQSIRAVHVDRIVLIAAPEK